VISAYVLVTLLQTEKELKLVLLSALRVVSFWLSVYILTYRLYIFTNCAVYANNCVYKILVFYSSGKLVRTLFGYELLLLNIFIVLFNPSMRWSLKMHDDHFIALLIVS